MTMTLNQRVCFTIFQTWMVKDLTDSKISSLMLEMTVLLLSSLLYVLHSLLVYPTELFTNNPLALAAGLMLYDFKVFLND